MREDGIMKLGSMILLLLMIILVPDSKYRANTCCRDRPIE
jgi:hypothetical protein